MGIVVPETVRYTIHGSIDGRATANVIDYRVKGAGAVPAGRTEAADAMAGILINEVNDSWLPLAPAQWSFLKVSYVDLHEADGVTGERNVSGAITLPKAGTNTNGPMPANASVLVRKVIPRRRGARTGRIYLIGTTEAGTSISVANVLSTAEVTNIQTKMTSFLGDTNQDGGIVAGQEYDSNMVVVHILTRGPSKTKQTKFGPVSYPGEPLTGEATVVTSLVVDSRIATQRRRLRA